MTVAFFELGSGREIAAITALVHEYSLAVHGSYDAADSLIKELLNGIESTDSIIIAAIDMEENEAVAYAMAKIVSNHGDRFLYIVQIGASRPTAGKAVFEYLIEFARSGDLSCVKGFVPFNQMNVAARLWGATPEMVLMRRNV